MHYINSNHIGFTTSLHSSLSSSVPSKDLGIKILKLLKLPGPTVAQVVKIFLAFMESESSLPYSQGTFIVR
jgi:hypothetical protein